MTFGGLKQTSESMENNEAKTVRFYNYEYSRYD